MNIKGGGNMRTVDDLYHKKVLFVMEKNDKIARLEKTFDGWDAWFYHHRFFYHYNKLSAALGACERRPMLCSNWCIYNDALVPSRAFIRTVCYRMPVPLSKTG